MSDANIIMGVDPGIHTGVAIYRAGKLADLQTIKPFQLVEVIETVMPARVVFEDSRLQSHTWSRKLSQAAQLKVARDVGQIDAWCRLIVATCERLSISAHGISPKAKGAKLNAEQFEQLTGWTGRTNEHQRDAAALAWKFRLARGVAR
jgi:hypothetical protein